MVVQKKNTFHTDEGDLKNQIRQVGKKHLCGVSASKGWHDSSISRIGSDRSRAGQQRREIGTRHGTQIFLKLRQDSKTSLGA